MSVELLLFQTEDGRVPFSDWMDSIEGSPIYDIVMNRLARVEMGNLGYFESVGEGVIELKIDFGPGYRIYLGRDGRELVILLIGGDKRTQRTDIKIAKQYWKEYHA